MRPEAASVVVKRFLEGAFDVLNALLGRTFTYTAEEPRPVREPALAELAGTYPVCLRARVEDGNARVALLLRVAEATQLTALVLGAEPAPKTSLEPEDFDVLKEVAESVLGGGLTSLLETCAHAPEPLELTEVMHLDEAGAADLAAFLEAGPAAAEISFETTGLHGQGVLLCSARMEELVPENMMGRTSGESASQPRANPASLSPEEMSDILSGFGEDTAPPPGPVQPPRHGPAPANLDMVLDIRLVATARLGRVDMPIGEILSLGPGSIIEVGHLVDEPVELLINDRLIARGDVVVVDEKFGLRITEIISPSDRIRSLR